MRMQGDIGFSYHFVSFVLLLNDRKITLDALRRDVAAGLVVGREKLKCSVI